MHKLNERGELLIPLVLVSVLLLTAIGFGAWAFSGRQDYKNNVDAKIAEAVEASNETLSLEKEAEFAEREKSPYKTYQGPEPFGTLVVTYPRTWNAHVVEKQSGTTLIDGYFQPNFVPDTNSDDSFALRLEVLDQSYDTVIKTYESKIKTGKISVAAYRVPKVEAALGSRLTGEVLTKKQGVLVLLPMRDKTIRIWTEGDNFRGDFETVLNELTFNQ